MLLVDVHVLLRLIHTGVCGRVLIRSRLVLLRGVICLFRRGSLQACVVLRLLLVQRRGVRGVGGVGVVRDRRGAVRGGPGRRAY